MGGLVARDDLVNIFDSKTQKDARISEELHQQSARRSLMFLLIL